MPLFGMSVCVHVDACVISTFPLVHCEFISMKVKLHAVYLSTLSLRHWELFSAVVETYTVMRMHAVVFS